MAIISPSIMKSKSKQIWDVSGKLLIEKTVVEKSGGTCFAGGQVSFIRTVWKRMN